MRTILTICCCLLLGAAARIDAADDAVEVVIPQLPADADTFRALRDDLASTPEGGAAMMVLALLTFADDQPLGRQFLTIAVDRSRLQEGDAGYAGWQLGNAQLTEHERRLAGKAAWFRSYLLGTATANAYAAPALPWRMRFTRNAASGSEDQGRVKVFVESSGADSPRPITMAVNDRGYWKAVEWSSLLVGVAAPVEPDGDDL